MIRAEIQTAHNHFVFYEDTIDEAKAYVAAMEAEGVEIIKAEYFDRETRIADIRAGKV